MAKIFTGLTSFLMTIAVSAMSIAMHCHTHHCNGDLCQSTISELFEAGNSQCDHHNVNHHHQCNETCCITADSYSYKSTCSHAPVYLQDYELIDNTLIYKSVIRILTSINPNQNFRLYYSGFNNTRAPRGIPVPVDL